MKPNHQVKASTVSESRGSGPINGVDRIDGAADAPDFFPLPTAPELCVEDESFALESASIREPPSVLTLYLREIGRVKLLSREEEIELALRIQKGDEAAREQMIKANLRLVVRIARDFENLGLPLLDLISEGNIGLMKAVEQFDPTRGVKLSGYAMFRIKAQICRALSNHGRTIRLPVYVRGELRVINSAAIRLQELLGREPADEEIAQETGLPAAKVKRIREAIQGTVSLDATLKDWKSKSLAETMADENASIPCETPDHTVILEPIRQIMSQLNRREKTVLQGRFGLDGENEKTLDQIGQQLGLTRERIRQIQNQALAKLRKKLRQREVVLLATRCAAHPRNNHS
jgi:RNA polymerase primary sigma factor